MNNNNKNITILSYNVASSHHLSGLNQLISLFHPTLIFLQEVTINTSQLNAVVDENYKGECNLDHEDSNRPGTAVLWLKEIEVNVVNLVPCQIQCLRVWEESFINVYGFPGSQGERARRSLFGEDLLKLIAASRKRLPILVGDWNCVINPNEVSAKVFAGNIQGAH